MPPLKFPTLSDEKLKVGIIIGPQISELPRDNKFKTIMQNKGKLTKTVF